MRVYKHLTEDEIATCQEIRKGINEIAFGGTNPNWTLKQLLIHLVLTGSVAVLFYIFLVLVLSFATV